MNAERTTAIKEIKSDMEAAEEVCKLRSEQLASARDQLEKARARHMELQSRYLDLLEEAANER